MNKSIAIIGSGPAGLTAAIYTARAGLNTTVYAGMQPGGQLTTTTVIENFPGFEEGIDGPVLMENMQKQAIRFGTKVEQKGVTKLVLRENKFEIVDSYGLSEIFDAVIIASGATARYLGLDGEEKYIGRGYHSCATCDGFFYKNKNVIVIGGGDSAMEDATFLTRFANHVTILNRSEKFRASKIMFDRAKNNPKITIIPSIKITEFIGTEKIESVVLETTDGRSLQLDELQGSQEDLTSRTEVYGEAKSEAADTVNRRTVKIDGVFVAVGHTPNTKFVTDLVTSGQINMDQLGYLKPVQRTMTGIPGLFIAGDVEDSYYRQAITAAGDGCRAAMDLEKWIESQD
jgi:thioredoxin reductase (NADPH)